MPPNEETRLEDMFRSQEMREFTETPEFQDTLKEIVEECVPNGKWIKRYGPNPDCVTLTEYDNYLTRRLSVRHHQRLDGHFSQCDPCREVLDELREVQAELTEHNIEHFFPIVPAPIYRFYDFAAEIAREAVNRVKETYKRIS